MMATADAFDLETVVRNQLQDRPDRLAPGVCLHLADSGYWLTPLHDVDNLIVRKRVDKMVFRDGVRDCDDYALALHYHMMMSQDGNPSRKLPHAFGEVWGMSGGTYGHAINIMVNSDGAVRFVEPQNEPDKAVMTVAECDLSGIWMIRI